MSTASAPASATLTANGPAAWRASVVTLEPLKREPFDLRLSLTPVWDLRSGLINGSVISRQLGGTPAEAWPPADPGRRSTWPPSPMPPRSWRTRAATFERLRAMPVSFVTLATQRAREQLMRLETDSVRTRPCAGPTVIEIGALDAVPPSRLTEVAGLVRGLCVAVVGRVRPSRAALDAARGCGLRGVSVEAARLGLSSSDPAARLNAFAAASRDIGRRHDRSFADDLPSAGHHGRRFAGRRRLQLHLGGGVVACGRMAPDFSTP